jgi:two-component system chemotaxis response regulator CheB
VEDDRERPPGPREASPLTDRLVVVGASAGGLEALNQFVAGLPVDLPAAVLVVVHLSPASGGALPKVLARAGVLTAASARNGDRLEPGAILVAPPDRHLLVHESRVRLSRGPRVNRQRPAIDVLFRSAASTYGPGVVAVVLSGALDDGAAGAAAIAAQDGAVLVQDPEEARVTGMPRAVLAAVRRARALPAAELGSAVADLVRRPFPTADREPDPPRDGHATLPDGPTATTDRGVPAAVGCPECQGGMFEAVREGAVAYICHVGHAWSAQTLLDAERQTVEGAIYNAASKLLEMAAVHRRLAQLAAGRADGDPPAHLRAAEAAEQRARRIEELATEES